MVGVPGKSKGCSTCRRRKKGCDQQRPVCGQCASSGYACGGYRRDTTFILHPASKAVERAIFIPHPRLVEGSLTHALNRTAVDAQCRGLFWSLYLPTGECIVRDPLILKCGHPMNWAELVPKLPRTEASLDSAFAALSVSRVGKENNDARLVQESTKIYGKALKDMQLALYDPARMLSDEVLTATMLLGLYEVLESPNPRAHAWLSHAQGAARLIELRGPHSHQKWTPHHLFLGSRMFTVYAAILQRKATYLASEQWLTVPWDEHKHRTYFDRLMDMLTILPGLLEQADATLVGVPNRATRSKQLDLLYQFECLQRNVNIWKVGMKKEAAVHIVQHQKFEGDKYPFDKEFWFANHIFARTHTIIWTCSLAIAETANYLQKRVNIDEHKGSYEATDNLFDAKDHAANICQSILYCLKPEMGGVGVSIITFPANMAFRYFRHSGNLAIILWLTKIFKEMQIRGLQLNSQILKSQNFDLNEPSCLALQSEMERLVQADDESSEDPGSREESPTSTSTTESIAVTKFIHEDPVKFYIDSSVAKG